MNKIKHINFFNYKPSNLIGFVHLKFRFTLDYTLDYTLGYTSEYARLIYLAYIRLILRCLIIEFALRWCTLVW